VTVLGKLTLFGALMGRLVTILENSVAMRQPLPEVNAQFIDFAQKQQSIRKEPQKEC